MSRRACLACLAIAPLVAACGGGGLPDGGTPANSAEGFTLTARAGLYETGGRRGLALVATLRDGAGRGPATPWSMTLRPPSGDVIALVYDDGSDGSFQAWWWESVEPATGPFQLTAQGTHSTITLPFEIADRAGLAPPRPGLTPDGNAIAWEAPAGAVAYACRFYAGPALAATTSPSPEARCDLGGLGDGSYTASVLAFTVDLAGLAADRGPAPALPAGFHVAQGRFGFVRGTGTVGHQLRTAGGALNFGTTAGGLALWIALGTPDGKPPAESWTVSVVGPGMSPSAPLTAVYPAGAAQRLLWSYDLLPRVGTYSVAAESGAKRLATSFGIADPPRLPIATGIVATPSPSGAAEVSWAPVAVARAYWVSVWSSGGSSAAPAAAIWAREPPARFAPGTFQVGRAYEVYVAAADVDMTLNATPPGRDRVAVSENTYSPVSFTAP